MPAIARLGDTSDHFGIIISASANVKANGIRIARVGDNHLCPTHGVTPIVTTPAGTVINGNAVATVGATAGCGATINSGSPNVNAGG